jgi:hypothetical protein
MAPGVDPGNFVHYLSGIPIRRMTAPGASMETVDYKAHLRKFYRPASEEVELVDVPRLNFIMIDGSGDPEKSPEYVNAVDALFAVSNLLKIMVKKGKPPIDYGVMPLEALWWSDGPSRFSVERKADWKWTLMVMQPQIITIKIVADAVAQTKSKTELECLSRIRFEPFEEGRAAQKLHVGPFSEEGPSLGKIHGRIDAIGGKFSGKHHEVYLSDTRKAVPEKWKTVIRQPYV